MLYEQINKIIWAIAIAMIFTSSIYFSLKLKFPQIKINKIFKYLKEQTTNQTMSIKDTLIMSLASKIGAGSLAGIAFAIYYGGPGTIFWMWVSAFICSIICYCENYLTTKYKEKDNDIYKGGPAYYIKKGLKSPILATTYSILAIMTYIFGFLAIQNNTITTLITNNFNIKPIIISLFIALLAGYIIIKGIKSTSKICNKLVPIMTSIYLIVGLIITITNINKIPQILLLILKQAFTNQAIKGGIFYTFIIGVQKGIFATEAAVGTSAIASGANCNKDPIKQGYIGIVETYFISFLIITTTAFIVLLFPYQNINLTNINGIELTNLAMSYHLGKFGNIMLLLVLSLFAFSTIITVYYYGESNLKLLTKNKKAITLLKIIAIFSILGGGITKSSNVWNTIDTLLALLSIINVYSIYILRKEIIPNPNKK